MTWESTNETLRYLGDSQSFFHWMDPQKESELPEEFADVISAEVEEAKENIANSEPSRIVISGEAFVVHHRLLPAMDDGKVAMVFTCTNSMATCCIFRSSPEPIERTIEIMNCVPHLVYSLSLKAWNVSSLALGAPAPENIGDTRICGTTILAAETLMNWYGCFTWRSSIPQLLSYLAGRLSPRG